MNCTHCIIYSHSSYCHQLESAIEDDSVLNSGRNIPEHRSPPLVYCCFILSEVADWQPAIPLYEYQSRGSTFVYCPHTRKLWKDKVLSHTVVSSIDYQYGIWILRRRKLGSDLNSMSKRYCCEPAGQIGVMPPAPHTCSGTWWQLLR